ncbi:TPA: hypothetical protein RQJ81_004157 [Vibrio vulnificus]|nr:hypothetical protein [Vibrio vulnificus]MCU8421968.1 hypothetical protein [Vibrio vulnificus]HDY7451924.1 hypothetical protein [Vibrio vulnificus]HDY7617217.1 hypothetical protein [Vibrio vulnificus]HDY7735435.1 hypothetical protein [Vibrio vulnificus]
MHGNDSWGRGGGVLSFLFFAAELSSAVSFLVFVILADAGTHRIASAVARFSHFIVGVAVGADQFSHSVILANAGTHPSAPALTVVVHNNPSNLRSLSPKTKKPTLFQVLA